MLFTVVESRDGRMAAQSADRSAQLIIEGLTSPRFVVGDLVQIRGIDAPVLVDVAQPVQVVTRDLSDEPVAESPFGASLEELRSPDAVPLADESEAK